MAREVISIKRYPNRRFYAKNSSKYVSLPEIEEIIRDGGTVEIKDNQSGEDITRPVLTQLILDRHPDKITLFPVEMLHAMLRANELMADFLRDYFRQSLTYLNYLQRYGAAAQNLANPIHWAKAWLDGISSGKAAPPASAIPPADDAARLHERIAELESRIKQLEKRDGPIEDTGV